MSGPNGQCGDRFIPALASWYYMRKTSWLKVHAPMHLSTYNDGSPCGKKKKSGDVPKSSSRTIREKCLPQHAPEDANCSPTTASRCGVVDEPVMGPLVKGEIKNCNVTQ